MLVMDISGSMDKNNKLAAAKEAAKSYVAQMRSGDQAGLITYDTQVYTVQNITADKTALTNAIDGLKTGSDTAMYNALMEAEKALEGSPGNVEAHILLANGLAGLKDFDAAVAQIEEAIRLEPRRGSTYTDLGALEISRGRAEAAERAFGKAAELEARLASPQGDPRAPRSLSAPKRQRQVILGSRPPVVVDRNPGGQLPEALALDDRIPGAFEDLLSARRRRHRHRLNVVGAQTERLGRCEAEARVRAHGRELAQQRACDDCRVSEAADQQDRPEDQVAFSVHPAIELVGFRHELLDGSGLRRLDLLAVA
jgi:tetratricopeptide (TPR) repeat protein